MEKSNRDMKAQYKTALGEIQKVIQLICSLIKRLSQEVTRLQMFISSLWDEVDLVEHEDVWQPPGDVGAEVFVPACEGDARVVDLDHQVRLRKRGLHLTHAWTEKMQNIWDLRWFFSMI